MIDKYWGVTEEKRLSALGADIVLKTMREKFVFPDDLSLISGGSWSVSEKGVPSRELSETEKAISAFLTRIGK